MTTPTIRRSIAAATADLAALLATPDGEFFEYCVVPEACVHGECAGALWDTHRLGAHIPLSESITYVLDDGLHAIELKGDEVPETWHFLCGQPITALMKHPLLDPAETIVEISTFRPDDPVDAASSTWIKLDCDWVPLFPDIFVGGGGTSRGHPHG